MFKLSEKEIRHRLQKGKNYEKVLYPQLKERNDKLRVKNKELKGEVEKLQKDKKQVEKLLLELEELREIVYGRKQRERKKHKIPLPGKESRKGEKKRRGSESYRREEPKEEEVTGEIRYEIEVCPDCGGGISKMEEHLHYREDLEDLDILLKKAKKVTKRIIESGYCEICKRRKRAMDIPKQKVVIGKNIKATIVYLHVLLGLSYREIEEYLKTQYNIRISDGMISQSLEEQSDLLRPYYQGIYQDLQKERGCHYDESSWNVQGESEGNQVWVKIGVKSEKVIFWFGRNRGKGVAEKLRGNIKEEIIRDQVGISDDYGAYRNLFEHHQLCWAHPHRKLRDLAESGSLEESVRKHCVSVYEHYATIYKNVQKAKEKFDVGENKNQTEKEKKKLLAEFKKLTIPHPKDPEKLRKIRESLGARQDRYFTCLTIQGISLDNNKAERALRRIVLKRKKSFESKSQKGANVLSILYSVVFSIYWSHSSENFFHHYQTALGLS